MSRTRGSRSCQLHLHDIAEVRATDRSCGGAPTRDLEVAGAPDQRSRAALNVGIGGHQAGAPASRPGHRADPGATEVSDTDGGDRIAEVIDDRDPPGDPAPAATGESHSEDNRVVDEITLDVERLP